MESFTVYDIFTVANFVSAIFAVLTRLAIIYGRLLRDHQGTRHKSYVCELKESNKVSDVFGNVINE